MVPDPFTEKRKVGLDGGPASEGSLLSGDLGLLVCEERLDLGLDSPVHRSSFGLISQGSKAILPNSLSCGGHDVKLVQALSERFSLGGKFTQIGKLVLHP